MKKVLFFTQTKWAFGSIHYSLCKELYKYDIYCDLLNWSISYSEKEFEMMLNIYDFFVTTPEAVLLLHRDYKVPLSRIVSVAHGQHDILLAKLTADIDFYPKLHKFGVISNILKDKCSEWGISTIPEICTLGINFNLFYRKPSDSLRKIGYGGANEVYNLFGQEIKRPNLVQRIIDSVDDLELIKHNFYHFTCMPAYYDSVDAVIMSSTEEAGGLPMMEGAAAGRLCIGTPVGYFEHNAQKGGGIILPVEENCFVESGKNILNYYKNNKEEYARKCLDIQEYAREYYDWSKVIDQWVKLF